MCVSMLCSVYMCHTFLCMISTLFLLHTHTHVHTHTQGFTNQQLHMVQDSTVLIEEREREITAIVQSISEINEMYRDLATMVVDQVCACALLNYSTLISQTYRREGQHFTCIVLYSKYNNIIEWSVKTISNCVHC